MTQHNRPAMISAFEEDDEVYFLPPRSFLKQYSLLVEAVYLTKQPEPEVKHWMKRGGSKVPVRNYRAYRSLRRIDKWLYKLDGQIANYFRYPDYEIPDPERRERGKEA